MLFSQLAMYIKIILLPPSYLYTITSIAHIKQICVGLIDNLFIKDAHIRLLILLMTNIRLHL